MIVLGMHRSGTSLCSQILSLLGIDMADDIGRGTGNEAGHWERWEIVEFHDRVLRILDRDYVSATHDFALPSGWWARPEIRVIQRELEAFVRARMRPGHPFGFKDPRTARLLPLWTPIFRALNLDPRFVFCVRSPAQVARSLNARDGLPLAVGEYRWAVYNTECWRNLRSEACIIAYDSWFAERDRTLDRLMDFLAGVVEPDRALIAEASDAWINRSLRHDGRASVCAQQPALRYLYKLLSNTEQSDETRAAIDRFVEQFSAFQKILPFEGLAEASAAAERAQAAAAENAQALVAAQALEAAQATAAERAQALEAVQAVAAERAQALEAAQAMAAESAQASEAAQAAAAERAQALETAHATAAERIQALEAAQAQHVAQLASLHAALDGARNDALTARHESETWQARYEAAEGQAAAEIRRHQAAYADLLRWIAAFQNGVVASWSWRLTRPLRKVGIARAVLPPPPAQPGP